MLKRTWVEIDLETLKNNFNVYKSHLPSTQEIMAVVKADAYGHGETETAKALQSCGCKNFAVSNVGEAISLRNIGIKGQILILGYTPVNLYNELLTYDITQTLICEQYAACLADKGIKAQFAIDTGMNRIGLKADDIDSCERIIRSYKDRYFLTGLFTHLCAADTEAEFDFTEKQIAKFKAICDRVYDLNLTYLHCMNSAGGLWQKPYGNIVRVGIMLYGLKPNYNNTIPAEIKPVLRWKSVISMIKKVSAGETIGYGRSYKAQKEITLATIPTGYADGYNRLLSNKGFVFIHGEKAPIIGRICMDQMTVDVSGIRQAKFQDEVTLLDEYYTADDMANCCGTIGYEIICGISKRVPRVYKR